MDQKMIDAGEENFKDEIKRKRLALY